MELLLKRRTEILHALCSGGSAEQLESILDILLSQEEFTWEDYQNIQVTGRPLNSNARQLLDLVYTKGENTCELFLTALKQILPKEQGATLGFLEHSSTLDEVEDTQGTWTEMVLKQRPSLVWKLKGYIQDAVDALVQSRHFSSADANEVVLPVYTPSQQARRLLDHVRFKGESASRMLLQFIQKIEEPQSSHNQDELINSREFLTKFKKKLSSIVSAQSCFLSTYGRTSHMSLEDIFTEVQLELPNNKPVKLEDIVSPEDAVNAEADTVLVSGVAGSGKSTLLQRLHLLWSRGVALQDFLLVFPFSCRRLNSELRELSLQELLFQHCCWPDRGQEEIFQFIQDHPRLILFTFDGLDELKQSFSDDQRICCPTQRAHVHVLLFNLIQGTLMKGVRKVVTSRPDAMGPGLKQQLRREILLKGFSPVGIESFVRQHHRDPTVAAKVIESLQANTALLGLCHSPVLCWIVSQCHKELLGCGEGKPQTLTDVYLMIMQHFFQHKHVLENPTGKGWLQEHMETVLNLGKLAFDGIYTSCYVFSSIDLEMCNVAEREIWTGFLIQSRNVSQINGKCYEFLHLTIQCFFAALHVVLSPNVERSAVKKLFDLWNATLKGQKSTCFGVYVLDKQDRALENDRKAAEIPHLQIVATFVSGLLSQRHKSLWIHCFSSTSLEEKARQVAKTLSKGMQRHFRLIPKPVPGDKKSMHALPQFVWLIKCIYEMQDSKIAKDAMSKLEVDHLKLTYCDIGPVECTALAYVLQHLKNPIGLNLDNNSVGDVGVEQLLPCMHICNSLYLRNNNITDEGIRKLTDKGVQCENFQKIALFNNRLTDACTQHFSNLLETKQNFLSLRLGNNNLTADGAKLLAKGLKQNRSLMHLGLWGNNIGDEGAEVIANALESSTSLVWLSLVGNGVGSAGAFALSKIIRNSLSLEELWLTDNCITRTGAESLIEALEKNPRVKSVWLRGNDLSSDEVTDLNQREPRLIF